MLALTDTRTLLLSQGYLPLRLISWRRAVILVTLGKAEVLEAYEREVRAGSLTLRLPAVVRLVRAFRWFRPRVRFSRANLYARDGYTCQYCGVRRPASELTYDHVVPRAQGGRTSWTNIVTCCVPCNLRKGNRTPEQAGMRLRSRPVEPAWVPHAAVQLGAASVPPVWRTYLTWGELS